ncbi:hypothetical protein Chor_003717 [Crotalus horridus]
MANEELSTISQQLHSQAQIIESLTQAVCRLKQEKEQQQQSINHLEDEMDRLQHNSPGGFESLLGCSMKGMKSEFRSVQQQVLHQSDGDCTPDPFSCSGVMQDMLESKKILWQEYECIKREIEQLKHKLGKRGKEICSLKNCIFYALDCQEDELYNQVSATHEIKRIQNRYCKKRMKNYCMKTYNKVSLPSLKLENIPGEAIGGMLEKAEISSELSTSLPELNFSDF